MECQNFIQQPRLGGRGVTLKVLMYAFGLYRTLTDGNRLRIILSRAFTQIFNNFDGEVVKSGTADKVL